MYFYTKTKNLLYTFAVGRRAANNNNSMFLTRSTVSVMVELVDAVELSATGGGRLLLFVLQLLRCGGFDVIRGGGGGGGAGGVPLLEKCRWSRCGRQSVVRVSPVVVRRVIVRRSDAGLSVELLL